MSQHPRASDNPVPETKPVDTFEVGDEVAIQKDGEIQIGVSDSIPVQGE